MMRPGCFGGEDGRDGRMLRVADVGAPLLIAVPGEGRMIVRGCFAEGEGEYGIFVVGPRRGVDGVVARTGPWTV